MPLRQNPQTDHSVGAYADYWVGNANYWVGGNARVTQSTTALA